MRFVCDRCKSKYSISDEKVRGKILKIRCKRCGNIVEVRDPVNRRASRKSSAPPQTPVPLGPQSYHISLNSQESGGFAPAVPKAQIDGTRQIPDMTDDSELDGFDEHTQINGPGLLEELRRTAAGLSAQSGVEPAASEWYVSINDAPKGPMAREQVRAYMSQGQVGPESLVWREGYADWRPLRSSPELEDLLRAKIRSVRPVAPPPPPRSGGNLRGHASAGGRLSSRAALLPSGSPPGPAPPPPGLRGREVGRLGANGQQANPAMVPPSRRPPGRSESFGGVPLHGAAHAAGAAPPPEADFQVPGAGEPFDAGPPRAADGIDPNLRLGPQAAETEGEAYELSPSPSVMAEARDATRSRRKWAWAVALLLAVLAGIVSAVMFIQSQGNQSEAATNGPAGSTSSAPGTDQSRAAMDRLEMVPENPGQAAPPPPEEATENEEEGDEEASSAGTGTTRRVRNRGSPAPSGGNKNTTNLSDEERQQLARAKKFSDSVSPAGAPRNSKGGSTQRQRGRPLSSEQIRSTIGKNRASIQRCYEREMRRTSRSGDLRVVVRLTVQPSGVVSKTQVSPAHVRSSKLGTCIMGAARRWRFPGATGSSTVEAPFVLTSGRR